MPSSKRNEVRESPRIKDIVEDALTDSREPERRPEILTSRLLAWWPDAIVSFCSLEPLAGNASMALDSEGRTRDAWRAALCQRLADDSATREGAWPIDPPPKGIAGQAANFLGAAIEFEGTYYGALAVAFQQLDAESASNRLWALQALADQLAARIHLNEQRRALQALQKEREDLGALATIGDLVSPIAHDLQNVFNGILLQAAIIARQTSAEFKPKLESIRTLGAHGGQILRWLDQYRHGRRQSPQSVDLNVVVHELTAGMKLPGKLILELDETIPPASVACHDARRLLQMLLRNAVSVTAPQRQEAHLVVRTCRDEHGLAVIVEDNGPSISRESLARLFDGDGNTRPGEYNIELMACRGMVRRLGGRIRGENRPEGGLSITVVLPDAATDSSSTASKLHTHPNTLKSERSARAAPPTSREP